MPSTWELLISSEIRQSSKNSLAVCSLVAKLGLDGPGGFDNRQDDFPQGADLEKSFSFQRIFLSLGLFFL